MEANPLKEEKAWCNQGIVTKETLSKMRAMTMEGLYLHLGIDRTTFYLYEKKDDFITVTRNIRDTIREQKFTGAAADLLNANIIARDLGLGDSATVKLEDLRTEGKSEEDLLDRMAVLNTEVERRRKEAE